jgi:hypothetical protein
MTAEQIAIYLGLAALAAFAAYWHGERQLNRGWNLGREYEIARCRRLRDRAGRFAEKPMQPETRGLDL